MKYFQLKKCLQFVNNFIRLDLTICCKKVEQMKEEEIEVAFKMVEENMQALYENSNWGWKEKEKRDEMTEENARFYFIFIDFAFTNFVKQKKK